VTHGNTLKMEGEDPASLSEVLKGRGVELKIREIKLERLRASRSTHNGPILIRRISCLYRQGEVAKTRN